jgi:serine/threonine-protein kinase
MLTSAERLGVRIADKYQLLSVLGRGGMGVVYEAMHLWTGRRVALKLIDASIADDPEVVSRFLNEARAATRLEHPNVVEVLDMGRSEDGAIYQALELLQGETLAALLARNGKLGASEAVALLLPIMDALHRAHELGIIHRDIKPGNVFLRAREGHAPEPVLLDFGVAKLLEDQAIRTKSSAVLGTPRYMAPEQALGAARVSPETDVWAVGTLLFECVAGDLPFGRRTATAYMARVLRDTPRSLASVAPECPAHVVAAVDRALARDPEQRFATMRAFADALLGGSGGQAVERHAGREASKGWWRTLAGKLSR